jgi:hypothetical protein
MIQLLCIFFVSVTAVGADVYFVEEVVNPGFGKK